MNYIEGNKAAWEEAFEHRRPNWGDDNSTLLKSEHLPFLYDDFKKELARFSFKNSSVAQFCCNNGRELLSLMQLGVANGVGFDIAVNIIGQAKKTAEQAGIVNCSFVACNILDISEDYHDTFDYIFFTVGALAWFQDLTLVFKKVSQCLKKEGVVFIHDIHPVMNMLPLPEEDCYDASSLNKLAYSYFKKEPWVDTNGMSYMSANYESKPFTNFSYTLSDLVTAQSLHGITIVALSEYEYDIGLTDVYDKKGIPLSFIMVAKKQG